MQTIKKTLLTLLLASITSTNAFAVNIERVSLDTSGNNPNLNSRVPSVSSNSRFVVFESDATDLVTGDTLGFTDIFRYDRTTTTTIRVSVTNGGGQANQRSTVADVSDDGRFIVFASTASNLTAETDANGLNDIFLRDTLNNTTTLISKSIGGTTGNGASLKPVISDDGTVIAYESLASDILAADADTTSDVYRYIVASGTTELVSTGASGKGSAKSQEAALSFNGQIIAFSSDSFNLGGPLDDRNRDAFYRNFNTGTTIAITTGAADPGFTDSQQPVVSANGSTIIFESFRRNLVANDNNGEQDVFAYDVNTTAITRVSISSAGIEGDGRSGHPGVSSDGRYVVYESSATNLDTGDTNATLDVFVRDRALSKTSRISLDSSGNEGPGISHKPRISTSGRFVVFSSTSPLVLNDTSIEDAYLVDTGRVFSDLDGNGKSDIFWRHTGNSGGPIDGVNFAYLMDGISISDFGPINQATDQDWKIEGLGDFDGDGDSDVIWRHAVSGHNLIYLMDGKTLSSAGILNQVTTDWEIEGTGDFDGDGKDDILWRNQNTGVNLVYIMDGISIATGTAVINTLSDTFYKIVGVGDFNNDGKADILWRHATTGDIVIYLMNGAVISNAGLVTTFADSNWKIVGVGDFDRDSKSDILWHNATSGIAAVWLLDNFSIKDFGTIVQGLDSDWTIEQIGDFNGDDADDIFWRHATNGINWMYLMNGISISSNGPVNIITDLDWKVHGNIGTGN